LCFLTFWLVTSTASVLTSLLAMTADEVNHDELD
jgi:hypothetical protein